MDRAETDTEVLLLENDRYVLKDAVRQPSEVIFPRGDALEFDIWVDLPKTAGGLELLGPALSDQVGEHEFDLETVLHRRERVV